MTTTKTKKEVTYKIRGKAHMNITVWYSAKFDLSRIEYDGFLDNKNPKSIYIHRIFTVQSFEIGIERAENYIKRNNLKSENTIYKERSI